jgi:formylglycine-generating enzyme required for sulfatase activity
MLLLKAPGRVDIRVPIRMPRNGKVDRKIELPTAADAPPGFFFMAGGEVIVGGTTAGAAVPHPTVIPPSWIYHDEVTMAEYAQFLASITRAGRGAEARQRLPKDFGKNLATLNAAGQLVPTDGGDIEAFAKSPARGLSYNDATAYIAWRSQQDGLPYRLPKDWEWECACRGADARTYSWGNTPGKGLAVVTQGYGDTGKSMSWKWDDYKDESPWGIHNLAGGAAEWTMTKYDPKAKPEDPVFGQYAIRGNAWALPPVGLECAFRTSGQPDYFHPTIGFRMALDYPVKRIGEATAQPMETVHQH